MRLAIHNCYGSLKKIPLGKGFNLFLLGLIFLTACGKRHDGEKKKTGLMSQFVGITDNEDKGVKEILKFYNGQCKYSIGPSTSACNSKKNILNLK